MLGPQKLQTPLTSNLNYLWYVVNRCVILDAGEGRMAYNPGDGELHSNSQGVGLVERVEGEGLANIYI